MACNVASRALTAALQLIEPSHSVGGEVLRPCTLLLTDGTLIERALASEDARGFERDWWIHPDKVAEVRPCRFRMPAALATKLYAAGESGMGYEVFTMDLRGGRSLVFLTPNVVDFPDLPEGITTEDIVEVHPHEGRERANLEGYRGSANFQWLFYVPHTNC